MSNLLLLTLAVSHEDSQSAWLSELAPALHLSRPTCDGESPRHRQPYKGQGFLTLLLPMS